MILERTDFEATGIFGKILSDDNEELFKTLEHAYPTNDGGYLPKIPVGKYLCVRGVHELFDGVPFVTFEVTGVPEHTGILFHVGNTNEDSSGCILLGRDMSFDALLRSQDAFDAFMKLLEGIDSFDLTVL